MLPEITDTQIIAMNGKTLRGSFDASRSKAAIHMVSAWATRNPITLGQVVVDAKSKRTHGQSKTAASHRHFQGFGHDRRDGLSNGDRENTTSNARFRILQIVDPSVRIEQILRYHFSRFGNTPWPGRSNGSFANTPAVVSK